VATNVLVIPEDFRKDQFVLKPIVERMMAWIGAAARVKVCMDPLLGGVGEALKWQRLEEIIKRYKGTTRVFLLVVDRDCVEGRRTSLNALELKAAELIGEGDRVFLGEVAWQELEVWVLAGMNDLPKTWAWKDIRSECDPKERFYDAYASERRLLDAAYEGREVLAKEAARNYQRIRQLCPEDVLALEQRIAGALGK
jgi:hypothetical protein